MLLKTLATAAVMVQSVVAAPIEARATGYKNMAYYANWETGAAKGAYEVEQLNTNSLTHVIYAFGDIDTDGTVISTNEWADYRNYHAGDDPSEEGNNAYGNIKQLYLRKKSNRNLKTLFSIGGFTASQAGHFDYAIKSDAARKRFCKSAVKWMADWGMDGIDLDYEYPTTAVQGENFYQLIKTCRQTLDDYAAANKQSYRYLLTMATSAGVDNYKYLDFKKITARVDHVLLMAYDYAGSWSTTTGHQANVHPSTANPAATKLDTNSVIAAYISKGLSASQIILGLPLYGRSFANTHGLGKSYSGTGKGSDGEDKGSDGEDKGVWRFKDLPRPNAKVSVDSKIAATYTYDSKTTEFVTFDGRDTTTAKAGYLKRLGLGGAFFWKASGDKTGSSSLITIMKNALGSTDATLNQLSYPTSQFDNIKNGMA